ncbi:MAG: biopolymer transporter ExbD [Myxococcota bacterium]
MAFGRYKQAKDGPEELNLIPVMNLFVVLIPFLLAGAAFLRFGVIATNLPTNSPNESDVPKTPTTVAVTLRISPEDMDVQVASTSLTPQEVQDLGALIPAVHGKADADALQAHLRMLKEKYPKSTTLTVMPYDKMNYQELVSLLDKTRERDTGQLNDQGEEVYQELFPVTIFSRLLTKDPVDAEEEELDFSEGAGGSE